MRVAAIDTGQRPRSEPWPMFEYVTDRGVRRSVELDEARTVRFETALLAREIPSRPKQTHTPGSYFFQTTSSLIKYESYLESKWLTLLDFDPDVVVISSQPMRIIGPVGDDWLDHVPDFYCRLADGRGCIVDVKHPDRMDDERVVKQRELTQMVCTELGVEYRYLSFIPEQRWVNVSWLAGFRRTPLCGSENIDRLLSVAANPVRLVDLCAFGEHPLLVRPIVFHLCWKQQLVFDLDVPLRDDTLISIRK